MSDQGGGSDKGPSFSIDYSEGKNKDEGCIGGGQKMKKVKKLIFSQFSAIFIANARKMKQF